MNSSIHHELNDLVYQRIDHPDGVDGRVLVVPLLSDPSGARLVVSLYECLSGVEHQEEHVQEMVDESEEVKAPAKLFPFEGDDVLQRLAFEHIDLLTLDAEVKQIYLVVQEL